MGLMDMLNRNSSPATVPEVSQQTSDPFRDIATRAGQTATTVRDRAVGFYERNPKLVKTLGSAAVAIALASVANRMRARKA